MMYNNARDKYQDLRSCNELITHLITLRLVLKDTVKTEKKFKIRNKEARTKKINKLKLLEEQIFIMTPRNKHLGRSSMILWKKK